MKRITILLLLFNLGLSNPVLAQGPYVIYYAVDEISLNGTFSQNDGKANVSLCYYHDEALLSNFYPDNLTAYVDRQHANDYRVKNGYFYSNYGQTQNGQASYRSNEMADIRELRARINSAGHVSVASFADDIPKSIDFSQVWFPTDGVVNYSLKGTFAMVSEANTYAKLVSPSNAQLPLVSTQFATISVPDFYRYFPEDQIGWYQDGKVIKGASGYNFTFSRESADSLMNFCGLHSYQPFVKNTKFQYWTVGAIQIELSPNLAIGKEIIIEQPFCTQDQKNGINYKAEGHILIGLSVINNTYKGNFFDKNNKQTEFTLSKEPTTKFLLPENAPYSLKFETDFGSNRYSCPQYFDDVKVQYPKPISVTEPLLHNILCFGDNAHLSLGIDGNTAMYMLGYGDSSKVLVKGPNQNIALMKGSRDYSFSLNDSNGCVYEQALNFKAKEPSKLEATFSITNALCHEGNATVTIDAKGGTPYFKESSYRYNYTSSLSEQENSSLSLKAGTQLTLSLHDAHGCSLDLSDTTLYNPADFKLLVLQKQDNICPKGTNASILLLGTSEDKRYLYVFSKDGKTFNNEPEFKGLNSGTLTFLTKNQFGCIRDTTVTFNEPPMITIGKTAVDSVRCVGESNGSITLNVAGGTGGKKLWGQGLGQPQGLLPYRYDGLADRPYTFYAQDSLGCVDSVVYDIGTRSKIKHMLAFFNPSCNESSDGVLNIKNSGGVGKYQNEWLAPKGLNNELEQKGLSKGIYVLQSKDALGCSKIDTFKLTAPPMLQVDLQGYPLLCKGQHIDLDAGIVAAKYEWTGSKGFKANTKVVTLTEADNYTLKVTNGFGCTGSDTFELRASEMEFKAYFVVATHVVQGDTVVLLNYNAPIDSLVWNLNANNTITLPKLPDFRAQHVVFREQGEQEIQMTGYYKGCRDIIKKKVIVIDPKDRIKYDNAIGIKTSVIKSCGLFPNPNDGSFSIHIELNELDVPVALVLSSSTTGSILKQLDWKLYPYGRIDFTEDLPEGPYVVHVKVRDEVLALRFLVAYD